MITFYRTDAFDRWLSRLRDRQAKARILKRLRAAELGRFGDCKAVGEGVFEMRVHAGPGYRLYYMRTGEVVYLLLCGGDKSSQGKDIAEAQAMARELAKR
ncbi:type II toxin-antitoxin system RelE/ParE family toxin [Caenispirillum bisanense]|uniref:type II toxin-antitoxin system RelE/ParE family toxin n=1 Tax=Caenispirillum bisanense TaxID=414052 RepID=UPI0031E39ED5